MLLLELMRFSLLSEARHLTASCMALYPLSQPRIGTKTANGLSALRCNLCAIILCTNIYATLFYYVKCKISLQEWPHASYPPWAHGPGYVISRDIAKFIVRGHQGRDLKVI